MNFEEYSTEKFDRRSAIKFTENPLNRRLARRSSDRDEKIFKLSKEMENKRKSASNSPININIAFCVECGKISSRCQCGGDFSPFYGALNREIIRGKSNDCEKNFTENFIEIDVDIDELFDDMDDVDF